MRDVARLAGVSQKTVSRVVNGERYVRGDTRARVDAAIAELGFHRNDAARVLRPGQRAATLGLVIEDIANPFWSAIARGAEEVADRHGHMLVIGSTERRPDRERRLVASLLQRRVDGLMVVPSGHDHTHLDLGGRDGVPVVFLDRPPELIPADAVLLDNEGGAEQAVDHLLGLGHRRIAFVGGAPSVHTGAARLEGYRRAVARAGADVVAPLLERHSVADADAAVARLLRSARPPTAVFADNNRMTVGSVQAVHRAGADVAIAGFDDIELADVLSMPVALVVHDPAEMGRRAAELLFARLAGEGGEARTVVIGTRLVLRGGAR
jgi:LacI family transcriptional regulator